MNKQAKLSPHFTLGEKPITNTKSPHRLPRSCGGIHDFQICISRGPYFV